MNPHCATPPSRSAKPFGIYLHVPICLSKCPYCDFISLPAEFLPESRKKEIVRALKTELDLALRQRPDLRGRPLDTLYFGGGTPSLLNPDEISGPIEKIRGAFAPPLQGRREITLECNPLSSEISRLADFRQAGVNRVSLGVQSFHDETLKALGRRNSAEEAREACRNVRESGFRSWGLDLIFGVPRPVEKNTLAQPDAPCRSEADSSENLGADPDVERFRNDLAQALEFEPPHISVYGLTLHAGTPMAERAERGRIVPCGDEAQREMFLLARSTLTAAGMRHYEISNYARPGHESRHNTAYWTGADYLGLGVGAHSYLGGVRFANPPSLDDYLDRIAQGRWPAEAEDPPPSVRSRRAERIMLALRQCGGVAIESLNQWTECDFLKEYEAEIAKLTDGGLVRCTGKKIQLTEEGLLLSDTVFEEFF